MSQNTTLEREIANLAIENYQVINGFVIRNGVAEKQHWLDQLEPLCRPKNSQNIVEENGNVVSAIIMPDGRAITVLPRLAISGVFPNIFPSNGLVNWILSRGRK